uniref:Uncharacterized protein n=1 Tax=Ananas comosus var. bracteatus TaxID=296719 RepID=A0A6V7Q781_ANACO|nr:unnamed protein product [Ananas comosus var. bracteatus]
MAPRFSLSLSDLPTLIRRDPRRDLQRFFSPSTLSSFLSLSPLSAIRSPCWDPRSLRPPAGIHGTILAGVRSGEDLLATASSPPLSLSYPVSLSPISLRSHLSFSDLSPISPSGSAALPSPSSLFSRSAHPPLPLLRSSKLSLLASFSAAIIVAATSSSFDELDSEGDSPCNFSKVSEVPTHKNSELPLNAYMLHNLAHVELNTIDLAWDTVAQFALLRDVLSDEFFADFARMADDESRHFAWCS